MRFAAIFKATLMIVLALVLVACGGDDATSEPEAEPEAAEDAGVASMDDLQLSETITIPQAPGGTLSMSYPEGWFAEDAGMIFFGNTREVLTADMNVQVRSGQVFGTADYFEPEGLSQVFNVTPDANIDDLMNLLVDFSDAPVGSQMDTGPVETFSANGADARIAQINSTGGAEPVAGVIVVVVLDGGFGVMSFTTAVGEASEYDGIARNMAGTLNYQRP